MSDGRTEGRLRALVGARIVFANGAMSYECLIRNLSRTGARIVFTAEASLPRDFEIVIPSRGQRLRARLCWRDGPNLGVAFLAAQDEPLADRMAALESENDALRRQVAGALQTMARHGLRRDDLGRDDAGL